MPDSKMVALAHKVPDFSAASTAGDFRLSQLRGQIVVLYFYPKDSTPGCTTESQDFATASTRFTKAGATILGVSRDSLASHEKFRAKFELPFALLSDPDEQLCTLFGVMKQKNLYGKMVRGIERSTFLIDTQGLLRQEWRGVKIPGHVDAVLAAVQGLG
jgi:peroxiredoxin Q/BCP